MTIVLLQLRKAIFFSLARGFEALHPSPPTSRTQLSSITVSTSNPQFIAGQTQLFTAIRGKALQPEEGCALLSGGTVNRSGHKFHGHFGDEPASEYITSVAEGGLNGLMAIDTVWWHAEKYLSRKREIYIYPEGNASC